MVVHYTQLSPIPQTVESEDSELWAISTACVLKMLLVITIKTELKVYSEYFRNAKCSRLYIL